MINAQQLSQLTSFVIEAQDTLAIEEKRRTRYFDTKTPQGIHPLWCATTLLSETTLPELLREIGSKALLLHDILEDTTAQLPSNCPENVKALVEELTAPNSEKALEKIWKSSDEAKLLKLYDITSNLLDASWLSIAKLEKRIAETKKLIAFAENRFGNLNIVTIATAICNKWMDCIDLKNADKK